MQWLWHGHRGMEQKLPIVVGTFALVVVVAIWWQLQGGPPEVADPLIHPVEKAGEMGHSDVRHRSSGSSREDLRAKRDAWMAAREGGDVGRAQPGKAPQHSDGKVRDAAPTMPAAVEDGATPTVGPRRRRTAQQSEIEVLKHTALNDPDPDERISALWSLSISDEAQALPVLASALRDDDREVRLAAVQELGGLEEEAGVVDALAVAIHDQDDEIREEVVRLIGDTEDPRAADLVRQLLNDPSRDVREEAESVLESLEDE